MLRLPIITDLVLIVRFADDKDDKVSQKVLIELENIDDECDQNDIAFVKIDDDKEAAEWGIDEIPTIVSSWFVVCLNRVVLLLGVAVGISRA